MVANGQLRTLMLGRGASAVEQAADTRRCHGLRVLLNSDFGEESPRPADAARHRVHLASGGDDAGVPGDAKTVVWPQYCSLSMR